jgi:hypothetical protein
LLLCIVHTTHVTKGVFTLHNRIVSRDVAQQAIHKYVCSIASNLVVQHTWGKRSSLFV